MASGPGTLLSNGSSVEPCTCASVCVFMSVQMYVCLCEYVPVCVGSMCVPSSIDF